MIRPLRQRHRMMMTAMSLIIPTAFALGIAARKEFPATPDIRPKIPAETRNYTELWNRNDLWKRKDIRARLLHTESNSERFAVELTSMERIVRPDLLLYWVPAESQIQDSLPDTAYLLGSFDPSATVRLALPDQSGKEKGVLVLYSLADHEIVAISKSVTF
jgi:hypothetical protein